MVVRVLVPVLLAFVLAAPARAADAVTLAEALAAAAEHPDVVARREAAKRHAALDADLAGVLGNPTVTVQPGYRLAPDADTGLEGQVAFVQPLHLGGLGEARRETARFETAALAAAADGAALERVLEAGRAWVARRAAEEVLLAAREELRVSLELVGKVSAGVKAGALLTAELAEARTHAGEARLTVLNAEGAVFERGIELGRAVGRVGVSLGTSGERANPPEPSATAKRELPSKAHALPMVRARAIALQAAQAREEELATANRPTFGLGAIFQREAPDAWIGFATASLTLPWFEVGMRERAPAAAHTETLAGEEHDAHIEAGALALLALHDVELSRETLNALESTVLPAAEELASLREKLFAAGETTIVDVLRARGALASARGRQATLRGEHAWARVRLWLLADAVERAEREGGKP